jgi:hypothetical protein
MAQTIAVSIMVSEVDMDGLSIVAGISPAQQVEVNSRSEAIRMMVFFI